MGAIISSQNEKSLHVRTEGRRTVLLSCCGRKEIEEFLASLGSFAQLPMGLNAKSKRQQVGPRFSIAQEAKDLLPYLGKTMTHTSKKTILDGHVTRITTPQPHHHTPGYLPWFL